MSETVEERRLRLIRELDAEWRKAPLVLRIGARCLMASKSVRGKAEKKGPGQYRTANQEFELGIHMKEASARIRELEEENRSLCKRQKASYSDVERISQRLKSVTQDRDEYAARALGFDVDAVEAQARALESERDEYQTKCAEMEKQSKQADSDYESLGDKCVIAEQNERRLSADLRDSLEENRTLRKWHKVALSDLYEIGQKMKECEERNSKCSADLHRPWSDADALRQELRNAQEERYQANKSAGELRRELIETEKRLDALLTEKMERGAMDCDCIRIDADPQLFLVWRDGGARPTKAHESFTSAQSEAERLAKANPGDRFYVLYAIGNASRLVADVQWVVSDARFDDRSEIPF